MIEAREVKKKGATAALVALTMASCLQVVDPTANNISIVKAGPDLGMGASELAFAASVGTLSLAAFILTTGALGDRLGRRKVMLAGLLTAILGGVITAVAPSAAIFILGRTVSGIGIAASFGLSFALIREVRPDAIPKAVAFWLAGQTAAALALGLVAGWMAGFGWRFGYLTMPIVAALAFLMCMRGLPEAKAASNGPFDFLGLSAIAVALVGLIYGLSNSASYGWTSLQVILPLVVAILAFCLFVWWEARTPSPAFPVKLFKDPELAGSVAVGFSFNMWQAVVMIQLSLLWQYLFSYNGFTVSLAQMPMSLAMVVGATVAGRLLAKGIPASTNLIVGHILLIGTMVMFGFTQASSPYIFFAIPMIVGGFARMVNETTMGQYFVSKPPPALTGALASSKTAIGQTSFALGTALSSTFVFSKFGTALAESLNDAGVSPLSANDATALGQDILAGNDTSAYDPAQVQVITEHASSALLGSFTSTMFVIAGFLTVFAVISMLFFARANRLRKSGRLVDGALTLDGTPAVLVGATAGTSEAPAPSDSGPLETS